MTGNNPSLRRATPLPPDSTGLYDDVKGASQLFFVVEDSQTSSSAGTGTTRGKRSGKGNGEKGAKSDSYKIPYWAILRIVDDPETNARDKEQERRGWLFADDVDSHPTSSGRVSTGGFDVRTPPPAALVSPSPGLSNSSLPVRGFRAPVGMETSWPSAARRGPRTTILHIKVCFYHPEDSDVAADKDAILERIELVSGGEISFFSAR